jgi:hypothetical protein
METEGSLPYSQKPDTYHYPEISEASLNIRNIINFFTVRSC